MSITRRKSVSLFTSMALALSLVGIAPAAAYADNATTGSIDASATAITVTTGSSTDLSQYFEADDTVDGDYHLDYVVSDEGATVNKHSGKFIGTVEGDYVVTVYLMNQATPEKNQGKPCTGMTVLDKVTLNVTVAGSDAVYGYQGIGQNSIKVTDQTVAKAAYDEDNNVYNNTLVAPSLSADGKYYTFTYEQNAGFKSYNSASGYTTLNAGNITLYSGNTQVGTLGDATGAITVASADHDTKTIVLKIDASKITLGSAKLVFGENLCGNNKSVILGSTINFLF